MTEKYPIFKVHYEPAFANLREPLAAIVADESKERAMERLEMKFPYLRLRDIGAIKTKFYATRKGIIDLGLD